MTRIFEDDNLSQLFSKRVIYCRKMKKHVKFLEDICANKVNSKIDIIGG